MLRLAYRSSHTVLDVSLTRHKTHPTPTQAFRPTQALNPSWCLHMLPQSASRQLIQASLLSVLIYRLPLADPLPLLNFRVFRE
jgi:hypothetical protein